MVCKIFLIKSAQKFKETGQKYALGTQHKISCKDRGLTKGTLDKKKKTDIWSISRWDFGDIGTGRETHLVPRLRGHRSPVWWMGSRTRGCRIRIKASCPRVTNDAPKIFMITESIGKECNKWRNPKKRICRMMRPNMRRKQRSSKGPESSSTLTASYYDLVMDDVEEFLKIANSHTTGLKNFLSIE
ncbi:hypothetical protein B0H13DRAFT_1865104 [Mycena leptocephala]|nr:hypothetical protein B0H13DRAFT_1865104 [Mycena leptocephala]